METQKYVVGKYYRVKCVELLNKDKIVVAVVPVIGEPHSDAQFGLSAKHYHIDGRFLPNHNLKYITHKNGYTNHIIVFDEHDGFHAGNVVFRILKCKRESTGLRFDADNVLPPKYTDWYQSYIGRSCKGRRCPHMGQTMLENNGQLVCPLHGLTACIEKEVIVPIQMPTLTKYQANGALSKGHKVRHRFFLDGEYITLPENGVIAFEDGTSTSFYDFWKARKSPDWETGWEIVF